MFAELKNHMPNVEYADEYNPIRDCKFGEVKALFYESVSCKGQRTKVFGYYGIPNTAKKEKVPAVVLLHGGGGHAFYTWVEEWLAQGYAALAIDTTGYLPATSYKGVAGNEGDPIEMYTRLTGENGFVSTPSDTTPVCVTKDTPKDEQWLYHAIAATILAHNILKNDSCIDSDKIGLVGISWGSVVTALTIGYDKYAFAICVYGSAYLERSLANIMQPFKQLDKEDYQIATGRLCNVTFPILWMCWNSDCAFSIESNSLSYHDTAATGAILSIKNEMGHSHVLAWSAPECVAFANSVVKSQKLVRFITQPSGRKIHCKISDGRHVNTAKVYYLTEEMTYSAESKIENEWHVAPIEAHGDWLEGELSEEVCCYYVELSIDTSCGCCIISSEYIHADGCSEREVEYHE